MKRNIINLFKKIINIINNFRFRNKVSIIGNVDFSYTSKIYLSEGSNKQDVIIKDRGRMYGILASKNNGKITLEENVKIGYDSLIGCINSVTIGKGTAIAHNVTILDNNNHPINPIDRKIMYDSPWDSPYRSWKYSISKPIIIGENVWIGADVRINKGIIIGDNSIIAANSVVTKNVPENSIAAGNPAKIVKTNIQDEPRLIYLNE